MSYRSIIETLLYLDHFRNIDLFQQGFYYIKIYHYYEKDDIRVYSNPYSCYKATSKSAVNNQQNQYQQKGISSQPKTNGKSNQNSQQHQLKKDESLSSITQNINIRLPHRLHYLKNHEINQNECSYQTNVFYIRYAEEKVEIGDCINFRTEVEEFQNLLNESHKRDGSKNKNSNSIDPEKIHKNDPVFYLKVELMFQEASDEQIKNPRSIKLDHGNSNLKKFSQISSKLYKLSNMMRGLNEFYPVQFDALHFSTLNLTLHSAIMDGENSYKTSENNLRVVRMKAHTKKSREQKSKSKGFLNLTEFLFADDKEDDDCVGYIPIEVEAHEIEKMHSLYIQSLIQMHEKLKHHYQKYLKYLPEELHHALLEDKMSQFQQEPPQLVITHEAQTISSYNSNYQSFTNLPSPNKRKGLLDYHGQIQGSFKDGPNNLFQKINTTLVNKTKSKMEKGGGLIDKNQALERLKTQDVMSHKVFQYIEKQQSMLSRDESFHGLKVNNLDNIATKSKLDKLSNETEEILRKANQIHLKNSNMLKRQFQDLASERPNQIIQMLEPSPSIENLQDNSFNILDMSNVSNVLDENTVGRNQVRHQITSNASQGCSFLQLPHSDFNDKFRRCLDEEPLCEAFDALPEPLTKTISTSNLYQNQMKLQMNNQFKLSNNLPPLHKLTQSKKIPASKENKFLYSKQQSMQYSFIQNYSSKVLSQNQNIQNQKQQTQQQPSHRPPKFSQPAVPQTRSYSQNVPMSPPSHQEQDNYQNPNDVSNSSINFSELKREKGLSIPYIQVNQRNLQIIKSSKSYLGIFLFAIKGHHEPHFITKIIDSEVRQISVQIFQLWHKLINIYCCDPSSINKQLKSKYKKKCYEKVSEIVIKGENCLQDRSSQQLNTALNSTQKAIKRQNGSINEIRQFQTSGMGLNSMQTINTQRSSSLTKSQVNQKPMNAVVTPNIASLKHKMSYSNLIPSSNFSSQTNLTTQNQKNQHTPQPQNNPLPLTKRNFSSQYHTEDYDFDLPNSPTKISKAKSEVESLRNQLQSKKLAKNNTGVVINISDTDKKFRFEYEPLIVEEKYTRKGNKYDKSLSRPSSQLSTGSDKLQNTLVTDLFKNLVVDENNKKIYSIKNSIGHHLFVFVHGFQASSYDMRAIKNQVSVLLPKAFCLCSQANENMTEGSIEQMGINLANEIKKFIKEWCYSRDGKILFLKKLTFIGHSLGGLIIRSALPSLSDFKDFMHGYMSLGSPHLGYMYNSNSLIDAGMWVLKRWKKSQCLQQLSMSDATQKNETYLYQLSKFEGLSWFKQVILVSSYQDNYAPHDSARIQVCSRAARQEKEKGQSLYVTMAQNILDNLNCEKLYRLDINFKIDEKNLDSMIGRTAHILLMECEPLIEAIVNRYNDFFCE